MQKLEMNPAILKQVNEEEHKELVGMKQSINNLRHQVGLFDEQVMEIDLQKKQTHQQIQAKKQSFRERVGHIAKSYGLELGTVKDGKVWQFDEPNLTFVQIDVDSQKVSDVKNVETPAVAATN